MANLPALEAGRKYADHEQFLRMDILPTGELQVSDGLTGEALFVQPRPGLIGGGQGRTDEAMSCMGVVLSVVAGLLIWFVLFAIIHATVLHFRT